MKFAYEDLSPEQFEQLVVLLCQKLLGISVQGFAAGPDGGRDARFEGTAELYPSTAAPWKGRVIIQAKHTNGLNKYFGESDFFSEQGTANVVAEEIPRIQRLRAAGELEHYMLFANRRLTAGSESAIRRHLADACGVPTASIYLCGLEQLELWLRTFSDVPGIAKLDPVDSPLIVSPADLAEIVEAFARQRDSIVAVLDDPPTSRTSFVDKNVINNMSVEYAGEQRKKYLKETGQIREFLAAPENQKQMQLYEATVDEFQLKIVAHRSEYQTFDNVMNYLTDLLFARDAVLRGQKRLTRALLFYMYWNCDIGGTADDATADQALPS